MTRLSLERVGFVYPDGTRALEAVDLDVETGASVAIIGQNGSGKSTLVRHLDGLLRPTEGRVLHGGADTTRLRTAAMASVVGIAFQDPGRQIFSRRIRDEIAFGPRILGRSPDRVTASVAAALELVGLTDVADQNPYDIGYSRRKLLALASVYAMETPVVVLDEPTTGQDARGVARVAALVVDIDRGGTDRDRDQPRHALRRGDVPRGSWSCTGAGSSSTGRQRTSSRRMPGRRWPRRSSRRHYQRASGRGWDSDRRPPSVRSSMPSPRDADRRMAPMSTPSPLDR